MKNLNDLALKSKTGDEQALHQLIISLSGENKKIGRYIRSLYPNSGITLDEICSVGITSIYKATQKYETSFGEFVPFWKKIYKVESGAYIKSNSYTCHAAIYNGAFSLDQPITQGGNQYADVVGGLDYSISESLVDEDLQNVLNDPAIGLNKHEKDVLNLRCQGYKREEIALVLRLKPQSVSRILRSTRSKCSKLRKTYKKGK